MIPKTSWSRRVSAWLMAPALVLSMTVAMVTATATTAQAATDPFFTYTGSKPLASYAPGDVIKTRYRLYSMLGIPRPFIVVQLVYRTVNGRNEPAIGVTSVIRPQFQFGQSKAIAFQSAYDSLNPEHSPSRTIAGQLRFGGVVFEAEGAFVTTFLKKGYTVVVADTEGQTADFAFGPEYGKVTLDSLRAALRTPATGLRDTTRIGMFGYSGGAIATGWAAQLASSYAPDVADNIIGAAEGGVLVAPANNLRYVSGAKMWAGVMPMAIFGGARGGGASMERYLSDRSRQLAPKLENASIASVLLDTSYHGLRWEDLVRPEYADPRSIPEFVDLANNLNMGLAPSPNFPMFIYQAAKGENEGTPGNTPGIGAGDGVMIAGDVRTLARKFCSDGTSVQYRQDPNNSHVPGMLVFAGPAMSWLDARFAGKPVPNNCTGIAQGNSLAPLQHLSARR